MVGDRKRREEDRETDIVANRKKEGRRERKAEKEKSKRVEKRTLQSWNRLHSMT